MEQSVQDSSQVQKLREKDDEPVLGEFLPIRIGLVRSRDAPGSVY